MFHPDHNIFLEEEDTMKYVPPGQPGSIVTVAPRYENFIGGKWQEPTRGDYRTDVSPATCCDHHSQPATSKGCGLCAAECPCGAIVMSANTPDAMRTGLPSVPAVPFGPHRAAAARAAWSS